MILPGSIIKITESEFFEIPGAASHKWPGNVTGTGRNHPWSSHFTVRAHFYRVISIPSNNGSFVAVNAYGKKRGFHAADRNIRIEEVKPARHTSD